MPTTTRPARPPAAPRPARPAPVGCPGCGGGFLLCPVNGLVCPRCTRFRPAR